MRWIEQLTRETRAVRNGQTTSDARMNGLEDVCFQQCNTVKYNWVGHYFRHHLPSTPRWLYYKRGMYDLDTALEPDEH